jgi:hypothetical protein
MKNPGLLRYAAIAVLLTAVGGGFFFLGAKHATETMAIRRVTPDQVARAMQDDSFYSDFKEATLVMRGTVASVHQRAGDVVVEFSTRSAYKSLCDLGSPLSTPHVGDTITVLAEGATVERRPSAVMLTGCTLP